MTGALADRRILVTGASRGIGEATAVALGREGAAVVLASRDTDACTRHVQAIIAAGGRAFATRVDVGDDRSVANAIEFAVERLGGLDGLVNNAGVIEPIGLIDEIEPEEFARSIDINLVGAFRVLRRSLPHLLAAGPESTVVNISSGAASRPREGWSAYCAGKSGLAMLTQSVALEYGGRLRVFGFRPGIVDTEMQVTIRASGINDISRLSRDSLLKPEVPARAIAWLMTADAADLSGREVDIRVPEVARRMGVG